MDRREFIRLTVLMAATGQSVTDSCARIGNSYWIRHPALAEQSALVKPKWASPTIKVIGVGEFGRSAIHAMAPPRTPDVQFICIDSEEGMPFRKQTEDNLHISLADAGFDYLHGGESKRPESALSNPLKIIEAINGADMVILAVGMGDKTGASVSSMVAEIARRRGALTIAFATTPFAFDGDRNVVAVAGINALKNNVDTLILLPNDKLLGKSFDGATLLDKFAVAPILVASGIRAIIDVFDRPTTLNVDFADMQTMIRKSGLAKTASERAEGKSRAGDVVGQAAISLLLDEAKLNRARGVLVNIATRNSIQISEALKVIRALRSQTLKDTMLICGTSQDETLADSCIRVSLLVTGLKSV